MRLKFRSALLILGLLSACLPVARADEQSQVVKLSEIPAGARKTMLMESGKGKGRLGEMEKIEEDGEVRYASQVIKGNVERSFSVDAEGKLLSWQVFLPEVPVAAQEAIRAQVRPGRDKLDEMDRVVANGKVTFEVELAKDGKDSSFTVGEDGKMLMMEMELAETPKVVQKTIQTQAAGGVIKKLKKTPRMKK